MVPEDGAGGVVVGAQLGAAGGLQGEFVPGDQEGAALGEGAVDRQGEGVGQGVRAARRVGHPGRGQQMGLSLGVPAYGQFEEGLAGAGHVRGGAQGSPAASSTARCVRPRMPRSASRARAVSATRSARDGLGADMGRPYPGDGGTPAGLVVALRA